MKRVLYIDDYEADLVLAKEYFENSDYKIDCAFGAEQGLAAIANNVYDFIICDIMMPGEDGLEFAKKLSNSGLGVAFALTSGVPTLHSFDGYNGLNNYLGFILKPVTPQKLSALIERDYGKITA